MGLKKYKLVATCASGLENLVAEEIGIFGGSEEAITPGAVTFTGTLSVAYRACLWSRFSSRILLIIHEFNAPDTDTLYTIANSLDWQDHLDVGKTFAVNCTTVQSPITHSRFAALRVKDAVADFFQERIKERPSVDVNRPDVQINLFLYKEQATLSIDLSGASLHRRNYRVEGGEAPLKESLAAAIVKLSGWGALFPENRTLLDPMCGSGTLLIEAALLYGDIAPGLDRKHYGFLKWLGHDQKIWNDLVQEALDRKEARRAMPWPKIVGFDGNRQAVVAARKNIEQAGLSDRIHVDHRELARLTDFVPQGKGEGLLVVNPPYGERLSEINRVKYLYRCLGRKLREGFPGFRAGIFTGNPDLADSFGLKSLEHYRLYNGPIACQLRLYQVEPDMEKAETGWEIARNDGGYEPNAFANRLRKNLKKIFKWAADENITCFRVYDGDIPEYNVAIDLYEHWVHVQEYAPPDDVDAEKAALRLKEILQIVQEVLDVKRGQVFLKKRERQRGKAQYSKKQGRERFYEVREWGCRFLVNFSSYLDTGLFLDHRFTRQMIGRLANEKTFLNLFCYTGSATIHAALNGAKSTTSVDLSANYLDWLKNNMALNGLVEDNNYVVQEDCMKWLAQERRTYDLIFVDPPTFSNTKKKEQIFDVQRDHVELIKLAMKRLAEDGLLIFSTNFRRFKFDPALGEHFAVVEITDKTLPLDFPRKRIHHSWEIRHGVSM